MNTLIIRRTFLSILWLTLVVYPTCRASSQDRPNDSETTEQAIGKVLNAYYTAEAKGNRNAFLAIMTTDAVFLGTDPGERWIMSGPNGFQAYVNKHMKPGHGWIYKLQPGSRHIEVGDQLDTAWFDEVLISPKYGRMRSTGMIVLTDNVWRIKRYSLSFLVPNKIAPKVVQLIREHS